MDEREAGTPNPNAAPPEIETDWTRRRVAAGPLIEDRDLKALRDFFHATGGSVLFCLSAVSIFAGLSSIVGPVLGTTSALSKTLPAIGAIGAYEFCLFAVMLALVVRWAIVRDSVSLLILVAVFLVTSGMLVSTVANDAPLAVLGVGATVAAVALTQLAAIRSHICPQFGNWAMSGVAVLFLWNALASPCIAYYIGADVEAVRLASDVWPVSAWIPVVAVALLFVDAARAKPADAQQRTVFLRSPAMAWTFMATLVAGTAVHVYAARYVFDIPFYFVDYVPLIGIASLTILEIARGFGLLTRPAAYGAGGLALIAMSMAVIVESYDREAGLGYGLMLRPAFTMLAIAAALMWMALRHRIRDLATVAAAYVFAAVVFWTPVTGSGGVQRVDGDVFGTGAAILGVVVLLLYRQPQLWIAAATLTALIGPHLPPLNGWLRYDELVDGDRLSLKGMFFGIGVLLTALWFGRKVPPVLLWLGAAALGICATTFAGFRETDAAVYAAISFAGIAAVAFWRTRDTIGSLLLCIPASRLIYLGASEAGGWRYIVAGFALLAIGAVWSVRNQNRLRLAQPGRETNGI